MNRNEVNEVTRRFPELEGMTMERLLESCGFMPDRGSRSILKWITELKHFISGRDTNQRYGHPIFDNIDEIKEQINSGVIDGSR